MRGNAFLISSQRRVPRLAKRQHEAAHFVMHVRTISPHSMRACTRVRHLRIHFDFLPQGYRCSSHRKAVHTSRLPFTDATRSQAKIPPIASTRKRDREDARALARARERETSRNSRRQTDRQLTNCKT